MAKPWWNPFAAEAGDGTGITNTPEFLKKKLEVLGNERAKFEENLSAVEAQIAEEDAEWGTQKRTLQVRIG